MVLLLLHVIHLLDRIATGPDDIVAFWRRLHQLMRRKVRLMSDDRSLLHLAMDEKTSYVEGKLYSKFPNTQVVKLLVGCRADVNAIDDTKNTPLHICSKRALEESSDPNEQQLRFAESTFFQHNTMNSGFPDLVQGLEWLQPYSSDLDEATVDRVAHDLNSCLNENDNDFPFFKANFMLNRMSRKDRKRVVTKTVDGKPALFKACKQPGQLQFVKYFLDECGADVEQRG
ncbi:hypothetical protein CAPTEDRAFT_214183, partial [Capitella teleta]